jgi:nucleoside-diphosphate-sugar epimerase
MNVLVTGASGFIGRHVIATLLERAPDASVVATRHTTPLLPSDDRVRVVDCDLGRHAALERLAGGADVVIHLASYIGNDASTSDCVNAAGTAALVRAAMAAGARRVVYASSAAVYGWGVYRGAHEEEVVVAPATAISRSRATAERHVLGAGGIVLRPLFVDGEGDTRFVPQVARALRRIPFLVGGGRARLSFIGVTDLARAIVDLACDRRTVRGVFHATDQRPVTFRAVASGVAAVTGVPLPRFSIPYPVARLLLRRVLASAKDAYVPGDSAWHRVFLVSRDHWYDSSRLWGHLGWNPATSFIDRLPTAAVGALATRLRLPDPDRRFPS